MMKKLIVLVLATFMCSGLFAQGIEFEHGTFNEALAKAKKENKLVFMDCYTTWCGPCKILAKDIFTQKQVGDFFNKNFVSVKMDMEKGEGIDLNTKYDVNAYPTLLFIDAKGDAVHKIVGSMKADELIKNARLAFDPNTRLGALHEKYNNGNRDEAFVLKYIDMLKAAYAKDRLKTVTRELIASKTIADFCTKDLFKVIQFAQLSIDSPEIKYVFTHKNNVKEFLGNKEFAKFEKEVYKSHLNNYSNTCKDLNDLHSEIDKCSKEYQFKRLENFKFMLVLNYYKSHKQVDKWFDMEQARMAEYYNNGMGASGYLFMIKNILKDPVLYKSEGIYQRAVDMMKEIDKKENGNVEAQYCLAKLYLAMGNKKMAKLHISNFSKMDKGSNEINFEKFPNDL